jgi:hypothetical protein
VFEVALKYLQPDVPRLCVLLLRGGNLSGWRSRGLDPRAVAEIRISLAELPLVARALASGEVFVGQFSATALDPVARPLGLVGEALGLVLPVSIGKHNVGCVVGVEPSLQLMRRKAELTKLATKMDQALHIGYLRRQLLAV